MKEYDADVVLRYAVHADLAVRVADEQKIFLLPHLETLVYHKVHPTKTTIQKTAFSTQERVNNHQRNAATGTTGSKNNKT